MGSPRKQSKGESSKPLLHRNHSSSASSTLSQRSGLVDLVVEDTVAEETERVRARKEGGPGWNELESKRFVRQYPPEVAGEEIREGFEPSTAPVQSPPPRHATRGDPTDNYTFSIGDDDGDVSGADADMKSPSLVSSPPQLDNYSDDSPWKKGDHDGEEGSGSAQGTGIYGSLNERAVWGGGH